MSLDRPTALPWQLPAVPGIIEVRKSGMIISGKLTLQEWESVGGRLLSMADSATWWIADWLLFGESTFMDRYEEAIRRTSLGYQTLRNYAWVARRFDLSRRRDNLSFGHHAEVAALPLPEQDFWLRKAEERDWSRNRLRAEVRGSLRERRSDGPHEASDRVQGPQTKQSNPNQETAASAQAMEGDDLGQIAAGFTLCLDDDAFAQCVAAAQRHGLRVDQWAVRVLVAAALLPVDLMIL